MNARLISLNVGRPRPLRLGERLVSSAIVKTPVAGPLPLGPAGLAGDAQADLANHGGPDKAVCVYAAEHLADWSRHLGRPLEPGAFGENFTVTGLLEADVCIGDVYRVGGALLQVTQPRLPCVKLAARHGAPDFVRRVYASGRTGFYLRCLEPGSVQAGDPITRVARPPDPVALPDALRALDADDPDLLRRLLAQPGLSAAWQHRLRQRLAEQPAGR